MARGGITIVDVEKAVAKLRRQGLNPSRERVHGITGGSMRSVHKLLSELEKSEEEADNLTEEGITKEIVELAIRISKRLRADAYAEVIAGKETLSEVVRGADAVRAEYQDAVASKDERIAELESENAALAGRIETLERGHSLCLMEKVRLEEGVEGLKKALEVQEKRATDAMASLLHFRDAAKDQREQMERARDSQVGGLTAELRGLKASLAVKLDEIRTLNEQNISLTHELKVERGRARAIEQKDETRQLLQTVADQWGEGVGLMKEVRDKMVLRVPKEVNRKRAKRSSTEEQK